MNPTEQLINNLADYIELVGKQVTVNTDTLLSLAKFSQALADLVFDVRDFAVNTSDLIEGSLIGIEEKFQLITSVQDSIVELTATLSKVAMFSIGVDILHTIGFIVLGIYAIHLGRKLKEKEDDIT